MTWWLIYWFVYLPVRLAVEVVRLSLLALVWIVVFLVRLGQPGGPSATTRRGGSL